MSIPEDNYQSLQDYVCLSLKGFCMGIADVIPGVSGGTIAFLTGIYEDLIRAIRSFDLRFLKLLLSFRFREAFAHANWRFLAALLFGILTAVFLLSKIIHWLLHYKPVLLNAFFFGLIMASIPIIGRTIKKRNAIIFFTFVVSTIVMYFVVGLVPLQTSESMLFVFLSGVLAICAMILPGISGAFILVLIGKYQFIIEAVSERDFGVLIVLALGCGVGILTFVRILSWLLGRFHDVTLAILTGLVFGSLRKIWPWKETLEVMVTHKGKIIPIEQINILPLQINMEVVGAILLCCVGFSMGLLLSSPVPKRLALS